MNSAPLNGAAINAAPLYATTLFGVTPITTEFTLSEKNIVPMTGYFTLTATLTGQLSSKVKLTPNNPAVNVTFNLAGTMQRRVTMTGLITTGFDLTGVTQGTSFLTGGIVSSFDMTGSMFGVMRMSGDIAVTFNLAPNGPKTTSIIEASILTGFTLSGDLKRNFTATDDPDRVFKRPRRIRQFRRVA